MEALWTGFLNNEESESYLSCIGNTYWSSSSYLPNMKAIHWRIKVTYNFELWLLSADNLCKQFWTQIRLNKTSDILKKFI